MNFVNIPLFQAMQEKLRYHASRQAVLASNVANADTPNYKAMDIKAPDFASMMSRQSSPANMVMTNAMHLPGNAMNRNGSGIARPRENTYELNPIGNNVVIEEEIMKVGENQQEYQKVLSIYRKSIDMFKIALGRGGSA